MKKIVLSLAVLTATVALQAEDTALLAGGEVSGQVKVMHILSDKTNGWAPETGSGYLGTLKYVTPNLFTEGLKAGAAFYINGDTGLTDWDNTATNKPAQGMFSGSDTIGTGSGGDTATLLGQAYVEYKSSMFDATVGRQILNTPLTKIKWSLMPNFYEAAVGTIKPVKGLSLTALHISAMSYGSRSATDFMLIGENTGTAGVIGKTVQQGGTREQAKFINLGTGAGVAETNGMTAFNVTYKMGKNLKLSVWDYIADDISNTIYADVVYKIPVMKGTKLALSAQYLTQSEEGAQLAGTMDFSMYGAKAKVGNKKWSAYLAYNSSDDSTATRSGFHNAFGADPAYTSSLFSRNAYREDVSAYKIGGHYTIMKGLKIIASHADYGESKTLASGAGLAAQAATNDATETDIIIAYKPTKAWMLKIFNAIRKSEYSDATALGREMNHFRVVASYTF
ncbi:MAG: OprD family outer membrane porin [Sulfurimonas sp.]|nr:OprD family outer membrane porin [Sulfurimonas sp.]